MASLSFFTATLWLIVLYIIIATLSFTYEKPRIPFVVSRPWLQKRLEDWYMISIVSLSAILIVLFLVFVTAPHYLKPRLQSSWWCPQEEFVQPSLRTMETYSALFLKQHYTGPCTLKWLRDNLGKPHERRHEIG